MTPPAHGALGGVHSTGPDAGEVTYTPKVGFTGGDTFLFDASDSELSSSDQIATMSITMPVVVSLDPTEGLEPLIVSATALSLDGSPFPAGLYEWSFGGQTEVALMETHAPRNLTFIHAVALAVAFSLTLAGAAGPVSCLAAGPSDDGPKVAVGPTISGHVYGMDGNGSSGVVVGANNGGSTAITNGDGFYSIRVPFNWSGQITPQQSGHVFVPSARIYSNVTTSQTDQNFNEQQVGGGNQPPQVINPLPTVIVNEDAAPTVIDLSTVFSDPDPGELLSFSVEANENPSLVNIGFSGSSIIMSYTPNGHGTASITVRAEDPSGLFAVTATQVTVNPVNDPPSFSVPGSQIAFVGLPLVVQMSSVSPGPANESGQIVTFTATSNNQSVLPDADIVEAGNQITMTAIAAGGPVTVSVIAQDDGGTASGGVDVSGPKSFNVTVYENGPLIAGSLTPRATKGASVPIGHQTLLFSGSGGWQGSSFTATTEIDGDYVTPVPDGWTGSVSAADPSYLVLWPESHTYAQRVTGLLLNQNFEAWAPPIGVPAPPFGIKETHEMYAGERFDFDGDGQLEPGEEYNDAGDGPYTHYVDNTHPSATNSNNPYGTAQTPRLSIPPSLAAGSVVEVHGGPYNPTSHAQWSGNGTSIQPIFIRGASGASQVVIGQNGKHYDVAVSGSYLLVENFDIRGHRVVTGETNSADHIAIRKNHVHHTDDAGVLILPDGQFNVVFDNEIDHADYVYLSDDHGVSASNGTDSVWIIDNHMHDNSGDSVQFCHGCIENPPRSIYIGRNLMHDDVENGIDIKATLGPVIISQNEIYGHSSDHTKDIGSGSGIRINDEGEQGPIAILFNRVHNGPGGIDPDASSAGDHDWLYVIGNVIYDVDQAIHADATYTISNTVFDSGTQQSSGWGVTANNLIVSGTDGGLYFVDAANGDLRLVAGSPAIDTGVRFPPSVISSWQTNIGRPYGLALPQVDADGTPRPQGAAWDKGAYERP